MELTIQLEKIFFESLSKLNFILHDTYIKNNFDDEHYYTDFSNDNIKKLVNIKKIGIYDSLLIAVGGHSGLEADNRRFYYDPIYDNLSPIYYDSMPRILENFNLSDDYNDSSLNNNLKSFNYLKDGSKNSIKLLKELNLEDLQKKMKKNGFDISQSQLSTKITQIIYNLKTLRDFEIKNTTALAQDYPPKFNKLIKIVFSNSLLDDFQSCDFLKKNCKKINLKKKEINSLLNNQTIKKNGINYLYYGSNFFDKKFLPNKFGIKKLKKIKLKDFSIFHDISDDNISIDKKNKKIRIINISKKQNLILKGKIDNWNFIFKGSKEEVKSDSALFGSCITFIDSFLIDVNFDIKNTKCLDAIKFIRTKGSINKIMINNSDGDGLAADYSYMKIRNIYIKDNNEDCINFKKGKYTINKITLENCKDRGISSGLASEVKINNFSSLNTSVSVYAKDSSIISINEANIKKTGQCLAAYRVLDIYGGGSIKLNKERLNCPKNNFHVSKNSKWVSQ